MLWIDWVPCGGSLSNTTMLDTLPHMQEFNTVADDSMIELDLEIEMTIVTKDWYENWLRSWAGSASEVLGTI